MINIFLMFCAVHALVWFGSVYQFSDGVSHTKSLILCILLAIPTSVISFYACRWAYDILDKAWSVKLYGFAAGYMVFPILTWIFLQENPFNLKTIISIILAVTIVFVQVYVPDSY